MVALNFSAQFASAVESGAKRQTIRERCRVKVGQQIQLYTGQRTKSCRKLGEATCSAVVPVTLNKRRAIVDGVALTFSASDIFATDDGFEDYPHMWAWFSTRYKREIFSGFVIRWIADASNVEAEVKSLKYEVESERTNPRRYHEDTGF